MSLSADDQEIQEEPNEKACIEFEKLSPEEIELFIKLRGETYKTLFTGVRGSAENGMRAILTELGVSPSEGNIKKARKKWENLNTKYRHLKNPRSGSGVENGEETKSNWAYFQIMDMVMKAGHNINPPTLIGSSGPEEKKTSENEDKDFADDESVSSAAHSSTKKRKLISSPKKTVEKKRSLSMRSRLEKSEAREKKQNEAMLKLLKKDMKAKKKECRRSSSQTKAVITLMAASLMKDSAPEKSQELAEKAVKGMAESDSSSSDSSVELNDLESD